MKSIEDYIDEVADDVAVILEQRSRRISVLFGKTAEDVEARILRELEDRKALAA